MALPKTPEMEALEKEIKKMQREIDKKISLLREMSKNQAAKVGETWNGMNIKTRKASYLITRPDGLAIVMPMARNSYNERNIHWYRNGKKAEIALDHTRMGHRKAAIWLKEYQGEK